MFERRDEQRREDQRREDEQRPFCLGFSQSLLPAQSLSLVSGPGSSQIPVQGRAGNGHSHRMFC